MNYVLNTLNLILCIIYMIFLNMVKLEDAIMLKLEDAIISFFAFPFML